MEHSKRSRKEQDHLTYGLNTLGPLCLWYWFYRILERLHVPSSSKNYVAVIIIAYL